MPAPLLLTPELIAKVAEAAEVLLYTGAVAEAVGIARQTLSRWRNRGRAEQKRLAGRRHHQPAESEAIYLQLHQAMTAAGGRAQLRLCKVIDQAADGGQLLERTTRTTRTGETIVTERYARAEWTAAAWRLERAWPERWSNHVKEFRELQKFFRELSQKEHK